QLSLRQPKRRIVLLPGARGRRKLARLQVAKQRRLLQELDALHLQRQRLAWAWQRLPLARHRRTKRSPGRLARQSSEARRMERSKRMRLYSRKGNYKKVHVHGSYPHDRQRPMEGPNNS
ncbi:mCG145831, partial [Mus musculus]